MAAGQDSKGFFGTTRGELDTESDTVRRAGKVGILITFEIEDCLK